MPLPKDKRNQTHKPMFVPNPSAMQLAINQEKKQTKFKRGIEIMALEKVTRGSVALIKWLQLKHEQPKSYAMTAHWT
jgi:hypothetical protein